MTKEEAVKEIEKAFEPAFANYIITALTEGATVSDKEPQTFKWCTNCKEYDQEKHCCHRWSNVIRDTVEEMKQEYIEREVLDKIRAEIESINLLAEYTRGDIKRMALNVIDKYKTESEG